MVLTNMIFIGVRIMQLKSPGHAIPSDEMAVRPATPEFSWLSNRADRVTCCLVLIKLGRPGCFPGDLG